MTEKINPLKTKLSQLYWCNPKASFTFESVKDEKGERSWLDELLHGGLIVPDELGSGVVMLISGPPGTGKSTLASEMALRLANDSKLAVSYITTESPPASIIANAVSFGWARAREVFEIDQPGVTLRRPGGVRIIDSRADKTKKLSKLAKQSSSLLDGMVQALRYGGAPTPQKSADVVIVDSLNVLPEAKEQLSLFTSFRELADQTTKLLCLILDSPSASNSHFWEFSSDIVLQLDRKYGHSGYFIRTLEITKARFQSHALGKHQLKIYEKPRTTSAGVLRLRDHPFRTEGGIFIFPSIHYFLSLYKRANPTKKPDVLNSGVPKFDDLLKKEGYPHGRCIAMMGIRGGHKSHLGLVELLNGIVTDPSGKEKALVVSLRDDEVFTRKTIDRILSDWECDKTAETLQGMGLLEIAYFPPGYITPEEFFHRIYLCVRRMKHDQQDVHIRFLFNSLDQLASRFPLCAAEDVFIPGLIQMLSAEGATSFFVTASKSGLAKDFGLEAMAELILDFDRCVLEKPVFVDLAQKYYPDDRINPPLHELVPSVLVKVGRYAGGQAAGSAGILEYVDNYSTHPLGNVAKRLKRDLLFLPVFPEMEAKIRHNE